MNMTDYLEKNKVINLLEHNDKVCHYSDERYEGVVYGTVKALCMVIAEAPAADVQPIVYAHKTINVGRRSYCSNCGKLAIMEDFCSKCGAKVKDGDTE